MSFGIVIMLMSNVTIMIILSPCYSTSNVVTFFKNSNRLCWDLPHVFSRYLNNKCAFYTEEYFGFGGRRW